MSSLKQLKIRSLVAAALVFFSAVFVFFNFLDRPVVWFDEGITIEIARNFALFGELDVRTAPDTFSGAPYLVGTNGYPLTIPLAFFFTLFGFGFVQARLYMLVWLAAVLAAIYAVAKRLFGIPAALAALALTVSFASFYGNSLTATGELPGIFFFVLGLWMLVGIRNYFAAGVLWGLAMAAKPGVFLLLAHTALLYIIFFDGGQRLKKLIYVGLGFAVPVSIWVFLAFPLNVNTFYSIIAYVLNPIEIPSVTSFLAKLPIETLNEGLIVPATKGAGENVARNIKLLATHPTLIYFEAFFVIILFTLARKYRSILEKGTVAVLVIYGVLSIIFFLRGEGWFRYLLGMQILIFMLAYPALCALSFRLRRFSLARREQIAAAGLAVLFILQNIHLYGFSNIPDSRGAREYVAVVRERMAGDPDYMVGLYNVPEIAAFTDPRRTYHQVLPQRDLAPLGQSPLTTGLLPDMVVADQKELLIGEKERAILDAAYSPVPEVRKFKVYEKRI